MIAAAAACFSAFATIGLWGRNLSSRVTKTAALEEGKKLVDSHDCVSCHAKDHALVGPSFMAIADRYSGEPDIVSKLSAKIRGGGAGAWGKTPMTPHPKLTEAQLDQMVHWILSLKGREEVPAPPTPQQYVYSLENGKSLKLEFPLFVEDHKVTKDVFRGYELFNSYCFRCHGEDAVGGELAPDLRQSLEGGMTERQFIAVAMVGRKTKGMPSWAGFFDEKDIERIYEYVKGRSVGLVPAGRPPSESD